MEPYTLSKKQKDVMDIFWKANAPLDKWEVLEKVAEQKYTWSLRAVPILLNSLVDCKALRIAGIYRKDRGFGRVFRTGITPEEYAEMQLEAARLREERRKELDELDRQYKEKKKPKNRR